MTNTESNASTTKPTAATQGAQDAPKAAAATKVATGKKAAPKVTSARKTAKPATKKASKPATKKAKTEASIPREYSKKAIVIDLLKRPKGAGIEEIMQTTGWLRHTCRGLISVLGKTHKIESTKTEAGRTYQIASK